MRAASGSFATLRMTAGNKRRQRRSNSMRKGKSNGEAEAR